MLGFGNGYATMISTAKTALLGLTVTVIFGLAAFVPAHATSPVPNLSKLGQTRITVTRQGDFDGDGSLDDLYLVDESETGRVAVHVRFHTSHGIKDIRVTSLDANVDTDANLSVVHAGLYQADCGAYATDCQAAGVTTQTDSIILAVDGGGSVLLHWQGDHFEQDFVRSDEALMSHAMAAIYALNR